jgi:hypothetical protein
LVRLVLREDEVRHRRGHRDDRAQDLQYRPQVAGDLPEPLGRTIDGGFFIFESVNPPATTQVNPLTNVLTRDAEAEQDQEKDEVPADDYDASQRVQRQITQRRGQADFGAALLRAYGNHCAITRCDAIAALEAAHIRLYRGPASNVASNGILLRSDIHTLYDLDLIAIDRTHTR